MATFPDLKIGKSDIESLFPIFKSGKVAIVQQDSTFLGLITRVDLINHLRNKIH